MLSDVQGVAARLSFALVAQGGERNLREAAAAVEMGRARLLAEAMELDEAPLMAARTPDRLAFEEARREILQLQAEARRALDSSPREYVALSNALRGATAKLDEVVERICSYVPGFLPQTGFDEIRAAAGPTAIVYLSSTELGGMALIVRAGEPVQAVPLPGFTDTALRDRLIQYFAAYGAWKEAPGDGTAHAGWLRELDSTLQWCWQTVMGPLLGSLADAAGERVAVLRKPGGGEVWSGPGGVLAEALDVVAEGSAG